MPASPLMPAQSVSSKPFAPKFDQKRMRDFVAHLSAFPTRNTNTPELIEAAKWVADRFKEIPGLDVELMTYTIQEGRRIPKTKEVVQVVATLKGKTNRTYLMGGHLDSYNLQGDPMTAKAPGANDDLSGVVATLEVARNLAAAKPAEGYQNTLVFVAFTGEEQGLFGATALAKRFKSGTASLEGVFNNDTIGSSSASDGRTDRKRVRLYSEDTDHPKSRELARFIEWTTRKKVAGISIWPMFRRDRFGRGGDHTPFHREGFAAVRFIETLEDFTRQHTDRDLIEAMDFGYLANVAKLNAIALHTLANSDEAPTELKYDLKQSYDTTITWKAKSGVKYVVYYRATSSPVWEGALPAGETGKFTAKNLNKDDYTFAVGAEGGVPVPVEPGL